MNNQKRHSPTSLDTQAKAFAINLDPSIYGTIAEIGAGQEIARWFFRVGGAAGTIAKTMSAYDMTVSDSIYGHAKRYVSEPRLIAMLHHEFGLLDERLGDLEDKQLFVIADTVSARNYQGTNECHGWIGIRYREEGFDNFSDIILHINLLDSTNVAQQQALGIVGVNLLYAAFFLQHNFNIFLRSLLDDLGKKRVEVDVLRFSSGPFAALSDIEIGAALVRTKLAPAVLFSDEGVLVQPSSLLRHRKVIIERGAYRILNNIQEEVIPKATKLLDKEPHHSSCPKPGVVINEIALQSINEEEPQAKVEFQQTVHALISQAEELVMISRFPWYFNISQYLRRYTKEPIGFVLGTSTLVQLFSTSLYENCSSQLLEALGKLFSIGARVYPYAMPSDQFHSHLAQSKEDMGNWEFPKSEIIHPSDIRPKDASRHLYDFLLESKYIEPIL